MHADGAVADAFLFMVCHLDKVCEYTQRVPGAGTDARSSSGILCAIHRNYVHVIHVDCNSMLTWWVVTTDTKLVQIYLSNTTQGELVLSATPLRSSFENDRRSFCHAQLELNVDSFDMKSISNSQKSYLARRWFLSREKIKLILSREKIKFKSAGNFEFNLKTSFELNLKRKFEIR